MNYQARIRDKSTYDELWDIALEYAKVLEDESLIRTTLFMVNAKSASLIKTPLDEIRRALGTLILLEDSAEGIKAIINVYMTLDDFVSDEYYNYFLPKVGTLKEVEDRLSSGDEKEKEDYYKRIGEEKLNAEIGSALKQLGKARDETKLELLTLVRLSGKAEIAQWFSEYLKKAEEIRQSAKTDNK